MLGFLSVNTSKHLTELPAGLQAISKSTVFYGWNAGNLDVCIFYLKLKPNLKRKQAHRMHSLPQNTIEIVTATYAKNSFSLFIILIKIGIFNSSTTSLYIHEINIFSKGITRSS